MWPKTHAQQNDWWVHTIAEWQFRDLEQNGLIFFRQVSISQTDIRGEKGRKNPQWQQESKLHILFCKQIGDDFGSALMNAWWIHYIIHYCYQHVSLSKLMSTWECRKGFMLFILQHKTFSTWHWAQNQFKPIWRILVVHKWMQLMWCVCVPCEICAF